MKEYVMTLIVTLAVCSLAAILSPEGERGLDRYIKLAAGLCVLCVAISPMTSFLRKMYSFELDFKPTAKDELLVGELEDIYSDMLAEASSADVSEKLASMICRNIGLGDEDIEVFTDLSKENGVSSVEKVTVVLSGSAVLTDPHKISQYVVSLFACECEIVYK